MIERTGRDAAKQELLYNPKGELARQVGPAFVDMLRSDRRLQELLDWEAENEAEVGTIPVSRKRKVPASRTSATVAANEEPLQLSPELQQLFLACVATWQLKPLHFDPSNHASTEAWVIGRAMLTSAFRNRYAKSFIINLKPVSNQLCF